MQDLLQEIHLTAPADGHRGARWLSLLRFVSVGGLTSPWRSCPRR